MNKPTPSSRRRLRPEHREDCLALDPIIAWVIHSSGNVRDGDFGCYVISVTISGHVDPALGRLAIKRPDGKFEILEMSTHDTEADTIAQLKRIIEFSRKARAKAGG